jgi:hypothetical protein
MAQLIRPWQGDPHEFFEVFMTADQYGNLVGPANPTGMAVDAFGRARSSMPVTLYDSFHRYQENTNISTEISATGASKIYDADSSTVICTVNSAQGSYVYRETNRVFAYQPGKSLQILETFVMNEPKVGLRQRFGYFNEENGIFLQTDGEEISFVIRSKSSGTVQENIVAQSDWNMDKLDGTGYAGITLDISKAQILFMDLEWLGVGSVRMGFVVDGQFIHAHTFHHANFVETTYMGTACLPIRCEIENTATTASSSTLRVICATVISEGGYELRGKPRSASVPITAPRDIPTAGTYVPIIAIRLKSDRLDSIVLPKSISLLGTSNSGSYQYKVISGCTISGGTWVPVNEGSAVEYNIGGTSLSGGTELSTGYTTVSNQSAPVLTLDSGFFKYQLERNIFTSTPLIFCLAATGGQNGNDAVGSIEWDEIT